MALYRWQELWQLCHAWFVDGVTLKRSTMADAFAETKHFIYFYLGHCAILLFKTQ
jgi:hypothetical protein